MRKITGQVPDGAFQLLSVIKSLAKNDLPVHFNARFIEPVHLFQRFTRKTIVKHPAAQFRIRSLKRDVNGRHVIFDDALHIHIRHVGERYIISLQKGKPGIVVLKIERRTHSRGHLVNKAENTLIRAGTVIVHQSVFKNDTKVFFIILINLQQPFFTGGFRHQNLHIFILGQILIVEHVLYCLPIYLEEPVPGFYFHFLRNAARFNPGNQMSFFLHRLSPVCPGGRM